MFAINTVSCDLGQDHLHSNSTVRDTNVHSCYMFDCGSPSTFLCKFTPHHYFVSSVLKITQHSYDLQQWGNQVKHEKELAELRTSDSQGTSLPLSADQKTAIVTTETPLKLNNSTKPASVCHHYQFKCANSSECIAIYNVCDGIPQCPDGSDESVDLKCHMKELLKTVAKTQRPVESPHPTETKMSNLTPVLNRTPPVRTPEKVHITQADERQKVSSSKAGSRHMDNSKSVWQDGQASRSDYYQNNDDSEGLGSPFKHAHSQFVAANDPHVQSLNRWSNDYDQYSSHSVPFDQPYNAYDGNYQRIDDQYLSNPLSPEYDSVKNYGNYRQEDGPYWTSQDAAQDNTYPVEEFPQPALHSLNKPNNYPDKESVYAQQFAAQYPEMKRPAIHKPIDLMPAVQQRYPLPRQPPYTAYEEAVEKQLSGYPDVKPKHYSPPRVADDSIYSNDDLIRASLMNHLPIELDRPHHMYQYEKHKEGTNVLRAQNKGMEISEAKNLSSEEPATTVKPTKPVQRTVLDFKMSVTELYQASRTHSQEANSAILALVMGLTITVLLFVFLACRIKTIRKRMSRKGRALAHDADYLVNGMYL
ncbi:Low-density lipoprotein receptor-related like protein [Argiope bruennichi]|uniref:Low-density lipoprotein receptor-related like protein n=2 Tax=Argiope bruennichi TaxID=94029 RepID=A0A8T0FTA7_ARGBR|nr:Low-density lipoprotein receptor-related like protein [Argiope bruennichi]